MSKKAFTLAEVACAIVVLATALAGGISMFSLANKTSALNAERTSAYTFVREKLEELRAESFANIVDVAATTTIINNKTFTWTITVTDAVSGYVKQAVFNITWSNAFSGTSNESFTAYYFNDTYSRTAQVTPGSDENIDENGFISNFGLAQGSVTR